MSIVLISPGHPLLVEPGRPALWGSIPGSGTSGSGSSGSGSSGTGTSGSGGAGSGTSGSGGTGVVDPSGIAGLSGWWDAGAFSTVLDPAGAAIAAFGASVGSLTDKSGAGAPLTVYHGASSGTTAPVATPRLNGLLGGVGRNMVIPPTLPGSGQQLPVMDPDQGLISAAMPVGSGAAWTLFMVWSRPNWRQNSTAASALLTVGGTVVLAADNTAGSNRLVLFPGAQQTVLTTPLTRRHTHAVILRNNAGTGIDVWLDADAGRDARTQSAGVVAQRADAVPAQRRHQWRRGVLVPRSRRLATRARRRRYRQPAELRVALDPRRAQGRADPGDRPVELGERTERRGLAPAGTGRGVASRGAGLRRRGQLRQPAGRHLHPRRGHLSGTGARPVRFVPEQSRRRQQPVHLGPRRRRRGCADLATTATDTAPEDAADIVAIIWPWSETTHAGSTPRRPPTRPPRGGSCRWNAA